MSKSRPERFLCLVAIVCNSRTNPKRNAQHATECVCIRSAVICSLLLHQSLDSIIVIAIVIVSSVVVHKNLRKKKETNGIELSQGKSKRRPCHAHHPQHEDERSQRRSCYFLDRADQTVRSCHVAEHVLAHGESLLLMPEVAGRRLRA